MTLELLAPAKNRDQGMAAISNGADAVYIGAPAFGARQAAANSLEDIESLVKYAHIYGAKVYITLNTLLYDDELEQAIYLTRQLYNIGIDALIVQDMGLLQCDLPPIALHASTQTHNYTVEKVRFMEQVGMKRVILARETSLEQMRQIRAVTKVELEAFVHGALCVSFSGQCYLSQYLSDRSDNRGCCAQPCRSHYDLYNATGKLLHKDEHLLSLRDFDASRHLQAMADAGICSFKIEGRLKDSAYVCNLTAYYRQLLDGLMEGRVPFKPASAGKTKLYFQPDPERTFSRRYTDYFLKERQPMASFGTQKALGKQLGKVVSIKSDQIAIATQEPLSAGDGLCFFSPDGKEIDGFLVNRAMGNTIVPNRMPNLSVGTMLWRNNDSQFVKLFQSGRTAERKIGVSLTLSQTDDGYSLTAIDEEGVQAVGSISTTKSVADNQLRAREILSTQLSKLGGTPFVMDRFDAVGFDSGLPFMPTSIINQLRRQTIDNLISARQENYKPHDVVLAQQSNATYPGPYIDYRLNIVNDQAEQFYRQHGVQQIERGLEQTHLYDGKALMTTKYCLRYELRECLRCKNNRQVSSDYRPELYLLNNGRRLELRFNCNECEMQIFAKI